MKRAKQRNHRHGRGKGTPVASSPIKPRNPLATHPLLQKGGVHLRTDKRAERARQKRLTAKQIDEV